MHKKSGLAGYPKPIRIGHRVSHLADSTKGRRSARSHLLRAVTVAAAVVALLGASMTAGSAQSVPTAQSGNFTLTPADSFSLAWSSPAAPSCPFIELLGARGSGQPSGGTFHGLGPEVNKMLSVVAHVMKLYDYSSKTYALNYPAASVKVLAPSTAEKLTWFMGGDIYWETHNLKTFLDSIAKGVSAVVKEMKSIHKDCPRTLIAVAGYSQGAMVMHQALLNLTGSVTKCEDGTLLLADGNRTVYTRATEYGTSAPKDSGIETWIRHVLHLGSSPDIPKWAARSSANICNNYDLVCDASTDNLFHFSRGAKVHTSYAVLNSKTHRYQYDPVLSTAADNVAADIIGQANSCS
jgi:hypothetical protein